MNAVEIRIPQMGEGLREVLIVHLLKRPGDTILRDEPIYEMETDKAVMEVESPCEGTLEVWFVAEGEVIEVGAPIARILTHAPVAEVFPSSETPHEPHVGATPDALPPGAASPVDFLKDKISFPGKRPPQRSVVIPPRTRSYCRQLGISQEQMYRIPAPQGKLMPADVDRYLAETAGENDVPPPAHEIKRRQYPVPASQRVFIYRLRRSAQRAIPASMTRPVEWDGVMERLYALRKRHPDTPITEFTAFAYAVATIVRKYPRFRSVMISDDDVLEYDHLDLGIAVQRPDDELATAVVPEASALDFPSFARATQRQIARAIKGEDQATDSVQLLLTYMVDHEITHATPVLVAPAIAVLFVGAPFLRGGKRIANLALTFDHRLINGVGAAKFLNSLAAELGSTPVLADEDEPST